MMEKCYIDLPYVQTHWFIESDDRYLIDFYEVQYGKCVRKNPMKSAKYEHLTILKQEEGYNVKKENVFDTLVKFEDFTRFWGRIFMKNTSIKGICYIHGSSVSIGKDTFLFIGKSFSGKSTLISYLSANGMEYLTDDRLIIRAESGMITPLVRPIILRSEAKELLKSQYDLNLEGKTYKFHNYERWRYMPSNIAIGDKKVTCAFYIKRQEAIPLQIKKIEEVEAMKIYMENSLNISDLKDIRTFAQLAKTIELYELQYSSMEEVYRFLLNISRDAYFLTSEKINPQ